MKTRVKIGEQQRRILRIDSQGPVAALETIASIFIPLLPAIIAAGLFNGLANIAFF